MLLVLAMFCMLVNWLDAIKLLVIALNTFVVLVVPPDEFPEFLAGLDSLALNDSIRKTFN